MQISINMTVMVDDESSAVHVGEVLNRAAAGLALEGHYASLSYMHVPPAEDDPKGEDGQELGMEYWDGRPKS